MRYPIPVVPPLREQILMPARNSLVSDDQDRSPTVGVSTRPNAAIALAMACLIGAGLVYFLSDTVADSDLWGHVRFGQDILTSGSIEQKDPYSYLSGGQKWINHEWLAEILSALAYNAAGPTGLVLLKSTICLLTLALVWVNAARRGLGLVVGGLFTFVVTLLAIPWMTSVRPQIFSFLCFALVLIAIERSSRGHRSGLFFLPVIFALWANLHGGFLAGLAILGAWTVARIALVRPPLREVVLLLSVLALSMLSILVTPYGWELLTFLLRTATVPRPEIDDWKPLQVFEPEGMATVAVMIAILLILIVSKHKRDYPLLLVLGMVVAGPFVAHRHIPLAMLAMAILTAEYAADLRRRFAPPVEESPPRIAWTMAALIATFALALIAVTLPHFALVRVAKPWVVVPSRAVATLKASGVSGNLAIPFSWGEYALWHLGPSVKVSVDGRRETVYPPDIYEETLRFQLGKKGWEDLIRRPETDLVLTDKSFPSDRLMDTQKDWVAVYEDPLCRIFARTGSKAAEILKRTRVSSTISDRFPG